MKVEVLIPFWANYKSPENSLDCRPLVKIGGMSLINRTIEILSHVKYVDSPVIFTSDLEISNEIDKNINVRIIQRSNQLNSSNSTIEDVIEGFLQISDAEVILLIHPRSPFINPQTISDCIKQVISGKYDSAFVAKRIQRQVWFKGNPVNFLDHGDTPSLFKLEPILVESSSIFIFTRKLFNESRRRIGKNPFIREVGHFEGFEIDNKDDMKMAELMINAGLDKGTI
jgi:CMP-N-acetylneuraminic acid synthetase